MSWKGAKLQRVSFFSLPWPSFRVHISLFLHLLLQLLPHSDDGFWKPPPADMRKRVALDIQSIRKPLPAQEVFRRLTEEIMPYSTGMYILSMNSFTSIMYHDFSPNRYKDNT